MLFNSLEFAVFLVVVYGAYLVLPHRGQNRMLLAASYLFYGAWDWKFLGLIVLSTLVDFFVGRALGRATTSRARKWLVALSVATNLGILGTFKYAGFFAESLARLLESFGLDVSLPLLEVVLPVGISFYTFQTLSYTIDVYRGLLKPRTDLLDFALFVAFFPQLVAGPIERAARLLPQLEKPRHVRWADVSEGSWLILWGTFKKVVLADNLAPLVNAIYAPETDPTGLEVVLATVAFAFQIYGDFSGYTDVARGVARLLGIELMINFDRPYFATSPADFWRRWHISLSTWLRDYLYIPLGGNKQGPRRTYINLALTMLLGGLWHGAAWTFVLWGAYQGALLIVHRALRPALARFRPPGTGGVGWWLVRVVVTFQLTCLGWLIFRAESLPDIGRLLGALGTPGPLDVVAGWLRPLAVLILPVLLYQALQGRKGDPLVVFRWPFPVRVLVYVTVFYAIVLIGEDFGQPFIYFQF